MAQHMPLEARRELDPEVFSESFPMNLILLLGNDCVLESLSAATDTAFRTADSELAKSCDRDYVNAQITSLIQHLKKSDMLPCICFLLERQGCENLAL